MLAAEFAFGLLSVALAAWRYRFPCGAVSDRALVGAGVALDSTAGVSDAGAAALRTAGLGSVVGDAAVVGADALVGVGLCCTIAWPVQVRT